MWSPFFFFFFLFWRTQYLMQSGNRNYPFSLFFSHIFFPYSFRQIHFEFCYYYFFLPDFSSEIKGILNKKGLFFKKYKASYKQKHTMRWSLSVLIWAFCCFNARTRYLQPLDTDCCPWWCTSCTCAPCVDLWLKLLAAI